MTHNAILLQALYETCVMVAISAVMGGVLGGLLGVVLFVVSSMLCPHPFTQRCVSVVINIVRSIPYLILMIILIPFTRFVVGSSIGLYAAAVPLTVASTFLWARTVCDTFSTLQIAFVEIGMLMGLKTRHIIWHILLPEAKPLIIRQGALMIVQLIGFSAMAGAVGGGGLGDVAIRYGYQRYDVTFMLYVVITLVALVQFVQWGAYAWWRRCRPF